MAKPAEVPHEESGSSSEVEEEQYRIGKKSAGMKSQRSLKEAEEMIRGVDNSRRGKESVPARGRARGGRVTRSRMTEEVISQSQPSEAPPSRGRGRGRGRRGGATASAGKATVVSASAAKSSAKKSIAESAV